ncbi:ISL3 family transposase [Pediococcus pentosaceus]|uniref:ISL3 family transposase n=1 Tax=Pediococcus pentosaceus TaxID=1255 RepID=UPI003F865AC8
MSQDQSTKLLLQIKDKNITHLHVSDTKRDALRVYGTLSYKLNVCPYCAQRQVVCNGHKTAYVRLPNVSGRTVILILRKQRFRCKACGKTSIVQTPVVRRQHQISENTQHAIDKSLIEDRTMRSIADQYNVSTNFVSRRILALGKQTMPAYDGLPKTLCIDEFRSTSNQMSFITIDGQKHDIITILPGRQTNEIKQFFLNHYSLKNREQVTQVVMDLNAQYQTVIRYLFPNAKLIVDNFHLVQMTLRALNQTRVQLMKKYHPDTPEYRVLKPYWRLYLMNYEALEKSQPQWFSHLRNRLTQEQLIWSGLNLSHEFENTYFTAHKLVEAFRNRDYAAFTATLDEVENVSPQLFTTIKTFIKNKKLIQNMTSSTLFNGPIEGVNRKIKQIKRTAYGYRNWKNFVFRIQIEFKIRVKKRNPVRK